MKHKTLKTNDLLQLTRVPPGKKVSLKKDYDPAYTPKGLSKKDAERLLQEGVALLADHQDKLYAQDTYALLIIFQALDAAGKDGAIKHVMSGVNPQGCDVSAFKAPSANELDQDYLWRCHVRMPRRGHIGIFNRSYYEEVLVVRVHPDLLERQQLPPEAKGPDVWKRRFEQINAFEKYMVENGTRIVKFFLHVSKEEQKRRFLERIREPEKNWKFSAQDVAERKSWNDYRRAYEDVLRYTSTAWAPWHVIPADNKWFTRIAISGIICDTLSRLNPRYPTLSKEERKRLAGAKVELEME
jgi:PPK2 family polyphosphate:nucleotide phosphotransferase